MRTVTVQAGVSIDLGHQYDNYATEVVFPSAIITPFITNFGSTGTFAIWYRRSGDSLGYPIGSPLVTFDSTDSEVTWDVVESDTASPGVSQVQLRYIVDEVCVMSQIFSGNVADSVDTGEEVPEPMEQWADAIVSAGAGGQPTVATSASAMADHNTIYLYTGSESGYIYGHIYYWNGSAWTDGGAYGGGSSSGSGLTEDIKQALLNCFEHVAWTDEHGQDYVDALEAALYPPANLLSISAVYTQSGTVYDTDTLDSLRDDLVVTAHYDDSSSEVVTTYTLSGTLVGGTSTITVTYGGKTTTFTVNVYQPAELVSISAVYTQSGTVYDTDSLDSLKADLVVTANYDDSTTETVASTDYTLSGTLTEGTSTITVSYGGKTTTFTVTVTHATPTYITDGLIHRWDAIDNTANGHDSTATTWEDLVGSIDLAKASGSTSSWDANALVFTGASGSEWTAASSETKASKTVEIAVTFAESRAQTVMQSFPSDTIGKFVTFTDNSFNVNGNSQKSYPTGESALTDLHHIAVVIDSTGAITAVYGNGTLKTQGSTTHSLSGSDANMNVGGTIHYSLKGKIHSIRMYNRNLTAEEIAYNYSVDVSRFSLE